MTARRFWTYVLAAAYLTAGAFLGFFAKNTLHSAPVALAPAAQCSDQSSQKQPQIFFVGCGGFF